MDFSYDVRLIGLFFGMFVVRQYDFEYTGSFECAASNKPCSRNSGIDRIRKEAIR